MGHTIFDQAIVSSHKHQRIVDQDADQGDDTQEGEQADGQIHQPMSPAHADEAEGDEQKDHHRLGDGAESERDDEKHQRQHHRADELDRRGRLLLLAVLAFEQGTYGRIIR